MEGVKLISKITDWNPVGIRTEGRPKDRWRDEVMHDTKKGKLRNLMHLVNPLTPNDLYTSRTAPLTSKHCILYIYSTDVGTEYFKHALYSPFFFSSKCSLFHNANLFGPCIIHILHTGCAEIKKNSSSARGLDRKACRDLVHKTKTHFGVVVSEEEQE